MDTSRVTALEPNHSPAQFVDIDCNRRFNLSQEYDEQAL
jgi:hypothetical protein